jgi:hypothetical protein
MFDEVGGEGVLHSVEKSIGKKLLSPHYQPWPSNPMKTSKQRGRSAMEGRVYRGRERGEEGRLTAAIG